MKTEDNIQKEVIRLINEVSFNDVNVNLICKNLNITRQAFYYHYENIYDVIYAIYLSNPIKNKELNSINDILNEIIKYLDAHKKFHGLIYESASKEILLDIVTSYLNKFLLKYLNKFKFTDDKKKSISRILSYGLSNEILLLYFSLNDNDLVIKSIDSIFNDEVINKIKKD